MWLILIAGLRVGCTVVGRNRERYTISPMVELLAVVARGLKYGLLSSAVLRHQATAVVVAINSSQALERMYRSNETDTIPKACRLGFLPSELQLRRRSTQSGYLLVSTTWKQQHYVGESYKSRLVYCTRYVFYVNEYLAHELHGCIWHLKLFGSTNSAYSQKASQSHLVSTPRAANTPSTVLSPCRSIS